MKRKIDELPIPFHRPRLIVKTFLFYAALAAAFVLARTLSTDEAMVSVRGNLYLGAALLAVLLDLMGMGALTKLLDRRPGLVLSPEGILDNSGPFAVGFVPWSEVAAIDIHEPERGGVVIVKVTDPEKYLRSGNFLARAYKRNRRYSLGSPVILSPNYLRIDLHTLYDECLRYGWLYGPRPVPAG